MAEIDKALPNVKQTINIPGPEEVEAAEQEALVKQQEAGEPIEQVENEDGSVEVNFDPSKVNIEGQPGHFDNLAELLPEEVLKPIGLELVGNYKEYKTYAHYA